MSDIDVHHEIKKLYITRDSDFEIVQITEAAYAAAFQRANESACERNAVTASTLSDKTMADNYAKLYYEEMGR